MKVDIDYIERAVKQLDYSNSALELDQGHIILDLIIELKAARRVIESVQWDIDKNYPYMSVAILEVMKKYDEVVNAKD